MKRPIFVFNCKQNISGPEAEKLRNNLQKYFDKWVEDGMKDIILLGMGVDLKIYFVDDDQKEVVE